MSGNPFFSKEDFQDLSLVIRGVNSTSSIRIPDEAIRFIELLVDGLWLEVPLNSCSAGHSLTLDIEGKKLSHKAAGYLENKVHVLGIIKEATETSETRQKVRVQLRSFSMREWEDLLVFFAEKQVSVNTLIKRTRK